MQIQALPSDICFFTFTVYQTCKGKILYILGYFLSAYCGYKMFMATINFVFSRDPNQDPVTRILSLAVCLKWSPVAC